MRHNFRTFEISLIIGIILISLFATIVPTRTVKAGGLISFTSLVEIEWADVKNETLPITPYQESRPYKLKITYSITKGPFGGTLYNLLYIGRQVDIKLTIESYPSEWSTVTQLTDTETGGLPASFSGGFERDHVLMIQVDDRAPAFKRGVIAIRVTVDDIGMIKGFDRTINLYILPDYAPKLNVVAEPQDILMGPMDIAEIPIKVTNLGNGETKVSFIVPRKPEDWNIIVTDYIILSPDETGTVYLTVKPPKGFGYHDDIETLFVEYWPAWSENLEVEGVHEQLTVSVESRGISIIGIEIILPIIIVILLIIFFVYYFLFKKMRRK